MGEIMGIVKAFSGAIRGTFADQWKEIITSAPFNEYTAVSPGLLRTVNQGRGSNQKGSFGVISNGSKIYVPENTAAVIFSNSGIESVISESGGYEYQDGEGSIFNHNGFKRSISDQIRNRVGFGGIPSEEKKVVFVNLREIRNIKYGTRSPQVYHDTFYDVDLGIRSFGSFSIKIVDPLQFMINYVPANIDYYSFDNVKSKEELTAEFLHSFAIVLNELSAKYRISQLPSHSNEIVDRIKEDQRIISSWSDRFGIEITNVAIESIEFTDGSRKLIEQFSSNRMGVMAYDNISQRALAAASQQKIAQGIQGHGLNGSAGMIMGMNIANEFSKSMSSTSAISFDQKIEMLKKLKELMDSGILTEEEFTAQKREILKE